MLRNKREASSGSDSGTLGQGPSKRRRIETYDVFRLLRPTLTLASRGEWPQLFRPVTSLTRYLHHQLEGHQLSTTPAGAVVGGSYHLDATDTAWLKNFNAHLKIGALPIKEEQFARVIEQLEFRTWDVILYQLKTHGIRAKYSNYVKCDVCRSPDTDLVYCSSCEIAVHRACYGITEIPDGQWLCSPCSDGVSPMCDLCPNRGGAMKLVPPEDKWLHMSCYIWVNFSFFPITRKSCIFCDSQKGLCIKCSVRSCENAYHVTCAIKHRLEMRAVIADDHIDGAKYKSYCEKHTLEKACAKLLKVIEKVFYEFVTIEDISSDLLDVDEDAIISVRKYWKTKRRAGHNRPLLPPKQLTANHDVELAAIIEDNPGPSNYDSNTPDLNKKIKDELLTSYSDENPGPSNYETNTPDLYKKIKDELFTSYSDENPGPSNYDLNTPDLYKKIKDELLTSYSDENPGPSNYETNTPDLYKKIKDELLTSYSDENPGPSNYDLNTPDLNKKIKDELLTSYSDENPGPSNYETNTPDLYKKIKDELLTSYSDENPGPSNYDLNTPDLYKKIKDELLTSYSDENGD